MRKAHVQLHTEAEMKCVMVQVSLALSLCITSSLFFFCVLSAFTWFVHHADCLPVHDPWLFQ